jgi:molybdopterin synthase catalytic subunit
MDVNAVLNEIRAREDINRAGMILVHFGQVRGFDLDGRPVTSLTVVPDLDKAEIIRQDLLSRPGIVDIQIRLNSGTLKPGDPIMLAVVAGETRDKIFPVMEELIERLKKEASQKTEKTA